MLPCEQSPWIYLIGKRKETCGLHFLWSADHPKTWMSQSSFELVVPVCPLCACLVVGIVLLLHSQFRWAGHVQRMDDSRLPKRLLYGELTAGQRSLGRPKKPYKDSLKESLKCYDIPYSTWEASANDRPAWRSLVSAGVLAFKANRIHEKDQIPQRRKERSSNPQAGSAPSIPCPHCNRHFHAKIGFFSHLRTHSTSQWYEVKVFASEGRTSVVGIVDCFAPTAYCLQSIDKHCSCFAFIQSLWKSPEMCYHKS